jgi:hypothetical protein
MRYSLRGRSLCHQAAILLGFLDNWSSLAQRDNWELALAEFLIFDPG